MADDLLNPDCLHHEKNSIVEIYAQRSKYVTTYKRCQKYFLSVYDVYFNLIQVVKFV